MVADLYCPTRQQLNTTCRRHRGSWACADPDHLGYDVEPRVRYRERQGGSHFFHEGCQVGQTGVCKWSRMQQASRDLVQSQPGRYLMFHSGSSLSVLPSEQPEQSDSRSMAIYISHNLGRKPSLTVRPSKSNGATTRRGIQQDAIPPANEKPTAIVDRLRKRGGTITTQAFTNHSRWGETGLTARIDNTDRGGRRTEPSVFKDIEYVMLSSSLTSCLMENQADFDAPRAVTATSNLVGLRSIRSNYGRARCGESFVGGLVGLNVYRSEDLSTWRLDFSSLSSGFGEHLGCALTRSGQFSRSVLDSIS